MKWVLVAAPAFIALILAGVGMVTADDRTLFVSTPLVAAIAGLGFAASATIAIVFLVRRHVAMNIRDAFDRGAASQVDNQSRFLARLDHELKNPLTAMRAAVATIEGNGTIAASVETQVMRLSRLTSDLRKLSEVRNITLEVTPVDPTALVDDVMDAVTELAHSASRDIHVSLPKAPRPLPRISGDYDLLYLALFNIVSNAVKYTDAGDTIEIRGFEADKHVIIEVADTGMGIAADEQETVWEELARGRGALAVAGSGLGLPFVRAIVDRHRGEVSLSSREGEGTSVRLTLPR